MPDQTCGADEARTRLPELLERAHRGEVTIITKRGVPYAAVVPLDVLPAVEPRSSLLALKGTGAGLWGDDPRATLRQMREEWP